MYILKIRGLNPHSHRGVEFFEKRDYHWAEYSSGHVVNALAKPIDGRGEISTSKSRLYEIFGSKTRKV